MVAKRKKNRRRNMGGPNEALEFARTTEALGSLS